MGIAYFWFLKIPKKQLISGDVIAHMRWGAEKVKKCKRLLLINWKTQNTGSVNNCVTL